MKYRNINYSITNTKFVTPIIFIVLATFFVTSVQAQDAIQTRKELMKNNVGAMKVAAGMAKGKIAYDAQKADLTMRTMNAVAIALGNYYGTDAKPPANSKARFSASPEIWKNMGSYKAEIAKFRADTSAAIKAAGSGEDDWKAAFGKVAKNCVACHKSYRVKNK